MSPEFRVQSPEPRVQIPETVSDAKGKMKNGECGLRNKFWPQNQIRALADMRVVARNQRLIIERHYPGLRARRLALTQGYKYAAPSGAFS